MVRRSSQDLINRILSFPTAPQIVEQVHLALAAERQKREAFYNDITEYEKAEFINGEIVIHSPVKKEHNDASGRIYKLVDTYVNLHNLGYVGYEKVMVRLTRNDYEPDICFFALEKSQHFTEGQSLFPAPDLVVEVLSKKTASNDRGVKFDDYRAHQVREYWIVDPVAGWVEQYRLDESGEYDLVLKSGSGPITCVAIRDFHTQIEAFFDAEANLKELLRLLQA